MKRPHFGALHMDLTTSVGSERKQLSSDKDRKIHMCIYINYQKKKKKSNNRITREPEAGFVHIYWEIYLFKLHI